MNRLSEEEKAATLTICHEHIEHGEKRINTLSSDRSVEEEKKEEERKKMSLHVSTSFFFSLDESDQY